MGPSCAATFKRSPSRVKISASSAPQKRAALLTTVSSTGWMSVGEVLMITCRISLVAVCCSSASVRSAFFACSSPSSRAFSMAMTAWSAKVVDELDLLSVNAPNLRPVR